MFNYIYGIFAIGVLNLWSIIYLDNIHKEISQIIMYKTHIGKCHQIESFDLIKLTKLNEWIFDKNNYHIRYAFEELDKQYGTIYTIHFDDNFENMKNGGIKIVPSFFKTSINIEFC